MWGIWRYLPNQERRRQAQQEREAEKEKLLEIGRQLVTGIVNNLSATAAFINVRTAITPSVKDAKSFWWFARRDLDLALIIRLTQRQDLSAVHRVATDFIHHYSLDHGIMPRVHLCFTTYH